jgi:hypothetical protein
VAAFERLCSSVFPVVARQLVGPGESPFAAVPTAPVRLLPCVGPLVGFQVRALRVNLLPTLAP